MGLLEYPKQAVFVGLSVLHSIFAAVPVMMVKYHWKKMKRNTDNVKVGSYPSHTAF